MKYTQMADGAEITIHVSDEDIPVRGNLIASGDDAQDRIDEDAVLLRLESGDLWAWCVVEVRAKLDRFSGSAFLGGCSYSGEDEFRSINGYFDQMVAEARETLAAELGRAAGILRPEERETLAKLDRDMGLCPSCGSSCWTSDGERLTDAERSRLRELLDSRSEPT